MFSSKIHKEIIQVLEVAYPRDLSIIDIAAKSSHHRNTVAKYLAVLESQGKVKSRSVGKAKLYQLAKK